MNFRKYLLVTVLFFSTNCTGSRADVLLDWKDNSVGIIIEDEITRDTRFEISWAVFEIKQRKSDVAGYLLNSPGGDVFAAEGIAYDIRKSKLPAFVLSGATCASACFIILAAANEKYISPGAIVAIHSAVTPGVGEDSAALAATMEIARSAAFDGIPDDIIGRLVSTPPDFISLLSVKDLIRIPKAYIATTVPFDSFTRNAKSVDKYWAGYAAGAYIASGKSSLDACDFIAPKFQMGCLNGLRDAPPE